MHHIIELNKIILAGLLFVFSTFSFSADWKYNESILPGTNTIIRTTLIKSSNPTIPPGINDQIELPILSITCTNKGRKSLLFIPGKSITIHESKVTLDYFDENHQLKALDVHVDLVGNKHGAILYGAQAIATIKIIAKSDFIGIRFKSGKNSGGISAFSDITEIENETRKLFEKCDL